MSGKRKATDMSSTEPKEKLSKKAKLKLARERAAEFGQRDKEKIESRKSKKVDAVSPKGNNLNQFTSKNKLTAAERKKISKENAEEFATRDRAALESSKKAAGPVEAPPKVVEHTQFPSNAGFPSQAPAISSNHHNFGAAIDPNQVEAYERMRQTQYVMMQQQQHEEQKLMQQCAVTSKGKLSDAHQHRSQAAAAAQHELLGNSGMNIDILSQPAASRGNCDPSLVPRGVTISKKGNDDDNTSFGELSEGNMPPPPPALMAQVSQQVLLNAQNEDIDINSVSVQDEKQDEAKENHFVADDKSKVLHSESKTEIYEHRGKTKFTQRWLRKTTLAIIVALIFVSAIFMLSDVATENLVSPNEKLSPREPICYFNSDSENEQDCSNDIGVLCPKGGVCEVGELSACINSYQDVLNTGDKCVLGEDYIPMKNALVDQLIEHASQICDHSKKPSFKYAMLQMNRPGIIEDENEDLAEALADEGFTVHEREDGLYVGLPEGFKVNLPIYCHLGNVGQWVLQEVGLLFLGLLRFISSNLFGFISTYPELSGFNLLLFFGLIKYRKHRASKKKRQNDIIRTRELAYKTLEESCGVEHCAIHIRDEIAMTLYPNSKKNRLELQRCVWPKIVDDVKRDTRVRKFQIFNKDGKTRDMWQWTAASKTPG